MWQNALSQLSSEIAGGRDAESEEGSEDDGMEIFQNFEHEGRELSLWSGYSSSSYQTAETPLLVSKLNDASLENEEIRLIVMQEEVALKRVNKAILEFVKCVISGHFGRVYFLAN